MTATTTAPQGNFYDHALNVGGANNAKGSAIARARREVIAEGTAALVEAAWKDGDEGFFWNGDDYTALCLAKDLARNNAARVRLTYADGRTLGKDALRVAHF